MVLPKNQNIGGVVLYGIVEKKFICMLDRDVL